MTTTRLIPLFGVLLATAACGKADNDLWGSIDESFSLEFNRVEIARINLWLRIEYLKNIPGGTDHVCKVSVDTENMDIKDNSELEGELFRERVTVERIASAGGEYPGVRDGTLLFEEFDFDPDGIVQGEFTVGFENGRNLMGNFDGRVVLISTTE